jgi:AcrR family transcriptional regulator
VTADRRVHLSRQTIIQRAIALADAGGVDALSMRVLARDLGYEVMSLYNYVRSKDEVLGAMVDAVAGEVPTPLIDAGGLEAARAIALETRAALVRHPWAASLWLTQWPGPARIGHMERLLEAFAASDMPPDVAHLAFHAVNNHVIGYTLQEQAMAYEAGEVGDEIARRFLHGISNDDFPHTVAHVRQHLDGETGTSFEIVLDLILDGLSRLASNR